MVNWRWVCWEQSWQPQKKEEWVNYLFVIPLQTRRGLGITHKCFKQLLLTRDHKIAISVDLELWDMRECHLSPNCSWWLSKGWRVINKLILEITTGLKSRWVWNEILKLIITRLPMVKGVFWILFKKWIFEETWVN